MNRINLVASIFFTLITANAFAQFTDSFDLEFGIQGVSVKTFETDFTPIELAVLPNDELLVLGRANFGNDYFTIAKFDANGLSLVPGYGHFNGFSQFGSSIGGVTINLRATDMLLLDDGAVIVSGSSFNITTSKFEIFAMKLTSQGQIDTQFGTNGITHFPFLSVFDAPIHGHGTDIAKGQNGAFFVSGVIPNSYLALVKFNADGQVATDFGENGLVVAENEFNDAALRTEVELFSDGRICVATTVNTYPNGFQFPEPQPAFYNFLPNGDVDPDFIQGARILSRNIDLGGGNQITIEYENFYHGKMTIDANDKVFLSGAVSDEDEESIDLNTYLISILSNGEYNTEIVVNPEFDTLITEERISVPGMISLTTSMDADDNGTNMLLLNDGTMIIAGYEYNSNGIEGIVRHVDNTGNPIVSFSNQGVFRYQQMTNSIEERFVACVSQSNGELIVLSTYANEQSRLGMYLYRLGEIGALSNGLGNYSSDNLIVFPNPAKDAVFVKTKNDQVINELRMFDLSGRLLISSTKSNSVQLNNLSKGVYVIEAQINDSIIRKRIIHN